MESSCEFLRILVPGRLAYLSASDAQTESVKSAMQGQNFFFFSSDLHSRYFPLGFDFGPVNLGVVHKFCCALASKMSKEDGKIWTYCFQETFEARANACFLLASFLLLYYGKSPQEAAAIFTDRDAPFLLRPFRDCTKSYQSFFLSLEDCLSGLWRATQLSWYDIKTFNAQSYSMLDKSHSGEVHEICPKFVAFKGPLAHFHPFLCPDEVAYAPEFYAPTLEQLGVTCVIRLNEPDTYDKSAFEECGIAHHDLYFDDCSCPPDPVIRQFLDICEGHARVAVHCRAGLGRTGTMIALWMMKHAGFGAAEAIAWLRIVRPGCVMGEQQQFLKACESRAWSGNDLLPAPPCCRAARPSSLSDAGTQAGSGSSGCLLADLDHATAAAAAVAQLLAPPSA